jgi:alpha-N-arabinofuranosidase
MQGKPRAARQPYEDFPRGRFCKRIPVWHASSYQTISVASLAATAFLATSQPAAYAATTTINIDTQNVVAPIDRRILGANEVWPLGMAGAFDVNALSIDLSFDTAFREAGLTTLRYPGGTVANLFHWRRAIGPQSQRLGQTSTTTVPFDSVFGPDEYGMVLDTYGLVGNIVVNIATGTAQEAADWVEYMTTKVGNDPHGLASLRAQNGHPDPYPIQYWEVGNEIGQSGAQLYWMGGTPTAADIARGCSTAVCRYTFGGYGHFTDQGVGTYDDFTVPRSLSDGSADQSFYVQFPPVVAGSAIVTVNGDAWTQASSLAGQGKAYTLDASAGIIRFGNGIDGQIPPIGARIAITYDSGLMTASLRSTTL